MPKKAKKNPTAPGKVFTKTIMRGPNKGDRVQFKVAKGGNPYPIRVLRDKGGDSTLKGDVPFGKKKAASKKRPMTGLMGLGRIHR